MTSRSWYGPFIVVTAAFLAAGCAPTVRSERDDNIPIPQGATWAWANAAAQAAQDTGASRRYIPQRFTSGAEDPIVQQRFRRAIEAAMRAKGFRRAEDTAQADFVLGFSFDGTDAYRHPAVAPVVGFGYYGGWYRPWGFGAPWGFYRPWGYYGPWGGPWGWGLSFAAYPAYGYGAAMPYGGTRYYRDGWLVLTLRLRSDGETAWIGRYRGEEHALRDLPQEKVQGIVNQVFATLR